MAAPAVNASTALAYREDIDGLRALAVLSIVLFHIDTTLVPGGFVGVDIFFVISGFLITSIIRRKIAAGTFSFADFYRRRVLRIAPAYVASTLATLAAGCFLMLPDDLAALGRSALWSAVSLPNVYFWRFLDTSYFAEASNQVPLLHLWSLGVEEQFYLLWPALLLILCKLFRSWLLIAALMLAAALASFAYGQVALPDDPSFAYYMLPARAGELLAGALIAIVPWPRPASGHLTLAARTALEASVLAGLILVGYGLFGLDENSTFPGFNALLPCVGTALLIAAGCVGRAWLMAPLRLKPIVWIGLISYSMYLWHWPILAFVRYFLVEIPTGLRVACFAATIAVAAASYRLIERPFLTMRDVNPGSGHPALCIYVLGVLAIVVPSILIVRTDGFEKLFEGRYPGYASQRKAIEKRNRPAFSYRNNCQESRLMPELLRSKDCLTGPPVNRKGKIRAILVGDSNAVHYMGVIGAIANDQGFAFRNLTMSSCAPLFNSVDAYGRPGGEEYCTAYRRFIKVHAADYDLVFLGAQWSFNSRHPTFERDLTTTIRQLTKRGKRVVILGQAPRFPYYDQNCELRRLRMPGLDCEAQSVRRGLLDKKVNKTLARVARRFKRAYYMDVSTILCPAGKCSPYLDGVPVYTNAGHMSMAGSWQVGGRIVSGKLPLRAVFYKLAAAAERDARFRAAKTGSAVQKAPRDKPAGQTGDIEQ